MFLKMYAKYRFAKNKIKKHLSGLLFACKMIHHHLHFTQRHASKEEDDENWVVQRLKRCFEEAVKEVVVVVVMMF